jgi:hypothetical protein
MAAPHPDDRRFSPGSTSSHRTRRVRIRTRFAWLQDRHEEHLPIRLGMTAQMRLKCYVTTWSVTIKLAETD